MGAKTPVKQTRSSGIKCQFCPRSFTRQSILEIHQKKLHATALKARGKGNLLKNLKRVSLETRNKNNTKSPSLILKKAKPTKIPGAKIKILNMPLEKDRSPSPVKSTKAEDVENSEMRTLKSTDTRKIEFACPKCDKLFPVYFSALRHIKKHHCVNMLGEFVDPSSEDLIKPVRTEMCIRCQEKLTSSEIHKCAKATGADCNGDLNYYCVHCKKNFLLMRQFDQHLPQMHSDSVESLFFSNSIEFHQWKKDMEAQTGCKYHLKGKYSSKEIYRCLSAHDPEKTNATVYCPSTVVSQEFPKGIQIHFYPIHYGHPFKQYKLTEKYKSVTITSLVQHQISYNEFSERTQSGQVDDLYIQFKNLMESIVIDAAKINIDTLKILVGKALEMTTVLTNYDAEQDDDVSMMSVDNLITSVVSSPILERDPLLIENGYTNVVKHRTRKCENSEEAPKQKKTKNKNTMFSLNDDKDSEKILKELDDTKPVVGLKPPTQFGQATFNDTYKDFVDKSYKVPDKADQSENTEQKTVKKKHIVKTKMGQFKPGLSPKRKPEIVYSKSRRHSDISEDIVYDVKETQDDCIMSPKKKPEKIHSKTRRYSNISKDIVHEVKERQDDSNMSPKKKPEIISPKRRRHSIISKDIVYEVKEREDDCNILILKL